MDGRPALGERVVVFGLGSIGLLTTRLLARFPLASLVTVDPVVSRRQRSLGAGATASVDPLTCGRLTELLGCAQADGADLVFELSGNPAALDQAIAATGDYGRVVIGSWYGTKRVNLELGGRFHRSGIRLIASQVSRIAPPWRGRFDDSRRIELAWSWLERLAPRDLTTHRVPFERAAQAYRLLDSGAEDVLQVVLEYPGARAASDDRRRQRSAG
jgi:threonine dehydrogenase-like Zn-dependent dehydrogenase